MILAILDPKSGRLTRWHVSKGAKPVKDAEIIEPPAEDQEFSGNWVLHFRSDPSPYMPKGWKPHDPKVTGKGAA